MRRMLLCGANCMGFYNVRDHVWACGFDSCNHAAPGNVALISHSGSGMCGLVDSEQRLRFNVAVSTGNELSVTMDEYLDFVLDLPETNAVGLVCRNCAQPAGISRRTRESRATQNPDRRDQGGPYRKIGSSSPSLTRAQLPEMMRPTMRCSTTTACNVCVTWMRWQPR